MIASIISAGSLLSCGDEDNSPIGPPGEGATVALVAQGLDFPVYLTAPANDSRLFVVEKRGTIRIIEGGSLLAEPFLDIRGQVSGGSEQGLLSLAFHPDYVDNGRFFVDFTDPGGTTRVVEYHVSGDPNRADAASATTILSVQQPFGNHNAGQILFGPDRMLYIPLGDGGSAGDPQENGQDLGSLLGALLRIDIDSGQPFAIPADNPFVGQVGARDEIWAYGLRNPWRVSFDRQTGDLYIADVGQSRVEEVNAVTGTGRGLNYGWNTMEGRSCFSPSNSCDQEGLTLPVAEYDHGDGCSVTGGYVYRGQAIPDMRGTYFYSDFCRGFVRSFRLVGGSAVDERSWPSLAPGGQVTSFGEDAAGELYILTSAGGVYQVVAE